MYYNLTYFDNIYLEKASDTTGEGLGPTRMLPSPHFGCQVQAQVAPVLLTEKIRGSHDPLVGYD